MISSHWAHKSSLLRDVQPASSALTIGIDGRGRIGGRQGVPHSCEPQPNDIVVGILDGQQIRLQLVTEHAGPWFTWREVDPQWEQPVAAALALAHWHLTDPRCDNCGAATVGEGIRRRCERCSRLQFTRTDPAVIVAVLDPDERLLLARQHAWGPTRHSVLAGFVEPGESLEQACWREVYEEAKVELDAVAYVISQPWPMPRSLMAGFVAATSDAQVQVDDVELAHGDFFTREQVRDMKNDGSIELPSSGSLGRLLIVAWLARELPRPR